MCIELIFAKEHGYNTYNIWVGGRQISASKFTQGFTHLAQVRDAPSSGAILSKYNIYSLLLVRSSSTVLSYLTANSNHAAFPSCHSQKQIRQFPTCTHNVLAQHWVKPSLVHSRAPRELTRPAIWLNVVMETSTERKNCIDSAFLATILVCAVNCIL